MGKTGIQLFDDTRNGFFSVSDLGSDWSSSLQNPNYRPVGGLFASVNQLGAGFGSGLGSGSISSPDPPNRGGNNNSSFAAQLNDLCTKYLPFKEDEVEEEEVIGEKRKKKGGLNLKLKLKISNPSLRRLLSGAVAGAISRTAVAPLETIRTHLMVGSGGDSTTEVFRDIMKQEGWKGLFRGNLVNVIRVAPARAVELFVFETVNKKLTPKLGEDSKIPIPASLLAGACAGVSQTLLTYPLELVKTRLTIQRGVYKGIMDAFVKIIREEGPTELYRGLAPSLIGVVPYAATNYFAYDSLRKAYRKMVKQESIGNIETLLIGSLAGALSSTATFPLEVARKHMQVGAVGGRVVYKNMLHALIRILEQEGIGGWYRGLGPSCLKLVPAAGISFMCYEACKKILVENNNEEA
ncbi:PREDICTED: adenine nucleotide transporter BT1, chloroplastic/mitochondrial-like [Camelina sativa]|uniref:Adenine nucleotide transporter BT1, chloroplastic/mitochondrial-like n=1 Tax=Camelina sativa TaxID=90675 RepID=A0ABM0TQ11_CAMSA|nr:PREDICTED: adenine nucleotide transporter BT1, chloroplastic/mitochondrial-like [Camelina sativa]